MSPLRTLGHWVGENPLRVSGAMGAIAAGTVIWLSLEASGRTLSPSVLLEFATARPAYPAALIFGVALLLFVDG